MFFEIYKQTNKQTRSLPALTSFHGHRGTLIGVTQPPPKVGAGSAILNSCLKPDLDTLLQEPSLGGDCVIPITVPYYVEMQKSKFDQSLT